MNSLFPRIGEEFVGGACIPWGSLLKEMPYGQKVEGEGLEGHTPPSARRAATSPNIGEELDRWSIVERGGKVKGER